MTKREELKQLLKEVGDPKENRLILPLVKTEEIAEKAIKFIKKHDINFSHYWDLDEDGCHPERDNEESAKLTYYLLQLRGIDITKHGHWKRFEEEE